MQLIAQYIDAAAMAAVPVIVGYVGAKVIPRIDKMLGINETQQQIDIVNAGISRAVGIALDHGIERGDALLTNGTTKNDALSKAYAYLNANVAPEMEFLGITPQAAADKVKAGLGSALHASAVAAQTNAQTAASAAAVVADAVAEKVPALAAAAPAIAVVAEQAAPAVAAAVEKAASDIKA